jgi:Tfp pilus assembly protein PilF
MTRLLNHWRLFVLFSTVIAISYFNSFSGSWQLDDKPNILANDPIQITQFSYSQLMGSMFALPGSGGFYRPLPCLSLAVNWYFGQTSVFGYHLFNLIIHILTAWIVFLTIKTLFSTPRLYNVYSKDEIDFISGLASLLWALNPIQTQAVTYIVQRMASMAALFAILALFMYLKARLADSSIKRIFFLLSSSASFLFAVFSKENAAALPLVVPFLELFFFKHIFNRPFLIRGVVWFSLGLIICILAGFAVRPEGLDFILNYYENRPFTLSERVLTESRILIYYITLIAYPAPWRLSIEHDVSLSTGIFTPVTTFAAIFSILCLHVIALLLFRKQPLTSFAIIFFFINHLVESTVVPLELIFEHRNYLPSLLLFVPFAQGVNFLVHRLQIKTAIRSLIILTTTITIILLGYATHLRNITWHSEESLWLDAVHKAPNSARPLATLAIKLAWGENPSEEKYRKALALTEKTLNMVQARKQLVAPQLGNIASILGKLGNYEKSIDYYIQALSIQPEDGNIRFNLAKTYFTIGNFSKSENELQWLLEKGYIHVDYFNLLSLVFMWQNYPEKALAASQHAFKYGPKRPDVMMTLGRAFTLLGHYQHAERFLNMARKFGGEDPILSLCLIENSLLSKNTRLAHAYVLHAIKQHPLPQLLDHLHFKDESASSDTEQNIYRTVPINTKLLKPYIQNQLQELTLATH